MLKHVEVIAARQKLGRDFEACLNSGGHLGGEGVRSPPMLARIKIFCSKTIETNNDFY